MRRMHEENAKTASPDGRDTFLGSGDRACAEGASQQTRHQTAAELKRSRDQRDDPPCLICLHLISLVGQQHNQRDGQPCLIHLHIISLVGQQHN